MPFFAAGGNTKPSLFLRRKICPFPQLSMSAVILIAVDILSNTIESEKTNKLSDDPERDVH